MSFAIVGIGLSMVLASGALAGVGHYDGVLGADDPETFLTAEAPEKGTLRVVVRGGIEDTATEFDQYRLHLVMPGDMRERIDQGPYVAIEFVDADTPGLRGFMTVRNFVPAEGDVLVVTGTVEGEWPLYDAGGPSLSSMPVLFLTAQDYHSPILFKR